MAENLESRKRKAKYKPITSLIGQPVNVWILPVVVLQVKTCPSYSVVSSWVVVPPLKMLFLTIADEDGIPC